MEDSIKRSISFQTLLHACASSKQPITEAMKVYTRRIHRSSDSLVNLKLAVAFTDPRLYAHAIGLFFHIYTTLESLVSGNNGTSNGAATTHLREVCHELMPVLRRGEALEADLRFFLGPGWEAEIFPPPRTVQRYTARLRHLAETEPLLLLPYIYHLYIALLSGGQLIRNLARRSMRLPKEGDVGTAVYHFDFPHDAPTVEQFKIKFRQAVDRAAENEDAPMRRKMLEESLRLFRMNNAVVRGFGVRNRLWRLVFLVVWTLLGMMMMGFVVHMDARTAGAYK